jgi:hypothetical protein
MVFTAEIVCLMYAKFGNSLSLSKCFWGKVVDKSGVSRGNRLCFIVNRFKGLDFFKYISMNEI